MPAHKKSWPTPECEVDGCSATSRSKTTLLCDKHYRRRLYNGSVDAVKVQGRYDTSFERLEYEILRLVEDPSSGCLLWQGRVHWTGYGAFSKNGKWLQAHRVVYEHLVADIPDGMSIDHVYERGCRNKSCVNPAHLEAVTMQENIRRYYAIGVIEP